MTSPLTPNPETSPGPKLTRTQLLLPLIVLVVLVALGLLVLRVRYTLGYLPLPVTGDAPEDVVARALGVRPSQLQPVGGKWPQAELRALPWAQVWVDDTEPGGPPSKYMVNLYFEPDLKSLRDITWTMQKRPHTDRNCTQRQAEALVKRTYRQAFGRWPSGLQLVRAQAPSGQLDTLYQLNWARVVKPGVETGAYVVATVNAKDGTLFFISRCLPVEHHDLLEVRVPQQQAEETALAEAQVIARPDDIINVGTSRIVLNCGLPPDDGPKWIVDVGNHGARPEWPPHIYRITVDAVTGQCLTKLTKPSEQPQPSISLDQSSG
jgi:hypothetical protein